MTAGSLELAARRRLLPVELFTLALLVAAPFAALGYERMRGRSAWLLVALAAILAWGVAVALLREWMRREILTLTSERLTWTRGASRIEATRADVLRVELPSARGIRLVVRDDDEESGTPELDYFIFTRASRHEVALFRAALEAWRRDGTLDVGSPDA